MDCLDWEAIAAMLSPLKSNNTPSPTSAPDPPAVTTNFPLPPDVLARIAASKKAAEDRRSALLKIDLTAKTPAPPTHSPAVTAIPAKFPTLPPDVLARIATSKKAAEDRRSERAWEKAKALMASLDQTPSSNMPHNTSPAPESTPATRPLWRDDLVQLLAVKDQASLTRRALQDVDVIERRERKKCRFGHVHSACIHGNNMATGVLLTKPDAEYIFAYVALEEMERTIEKLEKEFGNRVY